MTGTGLQFLAQLGQTDDPIALVPGDVQAVAQTACTMSRYAGVLADAGEGLRRIDLGAWTGAAADRFREVYSGEPARWTAAGDAFTAASTILSDYAATLSWAQGQAAESIATWDQAVAATRQAEAEHRAAVQQALTAALGGILAAPPPPFHDPGKATRAAARDLLERARTQLDQAGDAAVSAVDAAAAHAPPEPRWWQDVWHAASEYRRGVMESLTDTVTTAWSLSTLRMLGDPVGYAETVRAMASSLVYGVQHPVEFAKAVLDWETWQQSPWRALGHLGPDAALTVATAGTGTGAVRGMRAADAIRRLRAHVAVPDDPPTQVLPRLAPPAPVAPGHPGFGPSGPPPRPLAPAEQSRHPEPSGPPHHQSESVPRYDTPGALDLDQPTYPHGIEPAPHATPDAHRPGSAPGNGGPPALEGPAGDYTARPEFRTGLDDHEAFRQMFGEPSPEQLRMVDEWRIEHPEAGHLRTEELLALDRFRDQEAAINRALADGDPAALAELDPLIRETVSGLNRLPAYHGPVYYDASVSNLREFLEHYPSGEWVPEPTFTKADIAPPVDGNVHFVINSQNGKYLPRLDDLEFGTNQVIFTPGTEFKVQHVEVNTENYEVFITLSDVPR